MRPLIIITLIFFNFICNGQSFNIKDSSGFVTVEVPRLYNTYTFNKFNISDSTITINTHKDSIDVIIADFKNNKRVILAFPPPPATSRIKGNAEYYLLAGKPVVFTVIPDIDCSLSSNKAISIHFVTDESDNVLLQPDTSNTIFPLKKGICYAFKYTSSVTGFKPLIINLLHNNQIIESREFPVTFAKAEIELSARTSIINKYENIIGYEITSSTPVLADLSLSVTIECEVNSFPESIVIDSIVMPQNTTLITGQTIYQARGRQPRQFSIKSIRAELLQTEYENVRYVLNTPPVPQGGSGFSNRVKK